MKKLMCLLAAVFLVLSGLESSLEAKTLNVLTTTADLKSVVEYIGGDRVDVDSLGNGNQDYHFLAAKPSYMIKAKNADLFMSVGLELEIGYESLILEGSRNKKIQIGSLGYLNASEGISPLEVPVKVDRSMGDVHSGGNPHYWLDPFNIKIVARNITQRLAELNPEDEAYFKNNLQVFNRKIDDKIIRWQEMLKPYQGEKVLTYHKTFVYFASRFGFTIAGELEPKPGVPPSPGHLKAMVELIDKERIKVILQENIYPDNAARYVSSKIGSKVVVVPISTKGSEEAADYFLLMDTIIGHLVEGFRR